MRPAAFAARSGLALALAVAGIPQAQAFRPFDGTDAAVVRPGALEFEVGYLDWLRQGSQRSLSAPGMVANFGLSAGSELVAEGVLRKRLGGDGDSAGTAVEDVAISWKRVLRAGILQDARGPSIASECALLVPSAAGERAGAGCAGIVSQRISGATLHLNAGVSRGREGIWERSFGVIVEAPARHGVEPVLELSMASRSDGLQARSALAGVIVAMAKNLALDLGWRVGRVGDSRLRELRAGFTWSPGQ